MSCLPTPFIRRSKPSIFNKVEFAANPIAAAEVDIFRKGGERRKHGSLEMIAASSTRYNYDYSNKRPKLYLETKQV